MYLTDTIILRFLVWFCIGTDTCIDKTNSLVRLISAMLDTNVNKTLSVSFFYKKNYTINDQDNWFKMFFFSKNYWVKGSIIKNGFIINYILSNWLLPPLYKSVKKHLHDANNNAVYLNSETSLYLKRQPLICKLETVHFSISVKVAYYLFYFVVLLFTI